MSEKDMNLNLGTPDGTVLRGEEKSTADVDAIMKKYDRESNTRIWEGKPKLLVKLFSIGFSLYCIYVTLFSTAMPEIKLNIFLALILIMGYLHYPMKKGSSKVNHLPWYDILIMVAGAFPFFYFAKNAMSILALATRVTRDPKMVVFAILSILALMELCRRCVGIPILCVVGALLV